MKKTFTLAIFLLFSCSMGNAQSKQVLDSLKNELVIAKQDTSRVLILIQLCVSYRYSDPDSALFYGEQAFSLATKINFIKGQINALGFQGFAFVNSGDLSKALELSFKGLQIAKDNQLESEATPALRNIGTVYLTIKDYSKALFYFQLQNSYVQNQPFALMHIGSVYMEMNQLDSASYYANLALSGFQRSLMENAEVYIILGEIEIKLGNYLRALAYYQKGLQFSIKNNQTRWTAELYNNLAKFYMEDNQLDSSIFYAKKGLAEGELYSIKETLLESTILLSELYETIDAKESLRYYKMTATIRESLFGSGNIKSIQSMITREEERQEEIEAAKLESRNRIRMNAFLGSSFTLLVIAIFLFRNNRIKQKAKQKIEKAFGELKSTQSQLIQSEKMASLGELTAGIAHEIQNPLNFVNNFSEVNQELISELKEEVVKGDLEEIKAIANDIAGNEEKINHHGQRASGIVKGMLEHSRTGDGVKEPTDINALADEYLRLAYHGLRAKDKSFNANFKTDFDEALPKVKVIPQDIGRVLLNLINNAFYAVDKKSKQGIEDYKPEVIVITTNHQNSIEISVKDNGEGIPEQVRDKIFQPFFTTKPTGSGTGLGLSLSYDIVKAHGGDLKVESLPGMGSVFIFKLPIS